MYPQLYLPNILRSQFIRDQFTTETLQIVQNFEPTNLFLNSAKRSSSSLQSPDCAVAIFLCAYNYDIEFRSMVEHGNADALQACHFQKKSAITRHRQGCVTYDRE